MSEPSGRYKNLACLTTNRVLLNRVQVNLLNQMAESHKGDNSVTVKKMLNGFPREHFDVLKEVLVDVS